MRVRLGWSGETSNNTWQKVDVELEEEDLIRLLREADLPDELNQRLPAKVCYQLLQNEGEILLLLKLKNLGYPAEQADTRIGQLLAVSRDIVEAIKTKLQPV